MYEVVEQVLLVGVFGIFIGWGWFVFDLGGQGIDVVIYQCLDIEVSDQFWVFVVLKVMLVCIGVLDGVELYYIEDGQVLQMVYVVVGWVEFIVSMVMS